MIRYHELSSEELRGILPKLREEYSQNDSAYPDGRIKEIGDILEGRRIKSLYQDLLKVEEVRPNIYKVSYQNKHYEFSIISYKWRSCGKAKWYRSRDYDDFVTRFVLNK